MREEATKLSNAKRHSEGTFSNDYSKYLEDRKAQEFVRWLMNNKRSGWVSGQTRCFRTKRSEREDGFCLGLNAHQNLRADYNMLCQKVARTHINWSRV